MTFPYAGSAAIASTLRAHVVHAELAANRIVHCIPGELPEIYRRNEEQERISFGDCARLRRLWRRFIKKMNTPTQSNMEIEGLLKNKMKKITTNREYRV